MVGELFGFVPPAATGAVLVALDASSPVLVVALVVAGIAEGAILGASQARVVARLFPDVTGWTFATAAGAGIAWLAGMGGSALVGRFGPSLLVAIAPVWIVGLLAMGVLQWRRLRIVVAGTQDWVWWSAGAWSVGVMLPVAALSAVPNGWPVAVHVVVGVVAAIAMGAIVGLITAHPLMRYRREFEIDQHLRRLMGVLDEVSS